MAWALVWFPHNNWDAVSNCVQPIDGVDHKGTSLMPGGQFSISDDGKRDVSQTRHSFFIFGRLPKRVFDIARFDSKLQ